MTEKIEATLKRLAADTSKASSPTPPTPDRRAPSGGDSAPPDDRLGRPDCPYCGGSGYIRVERPLGDPDFGRLEICSCRQAQVRARIRQRLFSLSRLDELQHLTFATFRPRGRPGIGDKQQESLQAAVDACRNYARQLDGWLLLTGTYGSGKTHLAAAIANEAVEIGVPTLFLTVPDLLDTLRASFDAEDTSFEEAFERIRSAPLLILDDFGTHNATEWAREKLFQILNHRYINRLPLVVTMNLAMEEVEGRIRSRLSDRVLVQNVHLQAPDYRRADMDRGQPALSSLSIHAHQTFGTWSQRSEEKLPPQDRRTLEDAFRTAHAYAEKPEGWLLLQGTYGSGKTHLAAAIANYRESQGYSVMFVVVPDLLDHLRATFSPASTTSYDQRFEEVRSAPLLILDDLGTQATTPWVLEKLYQVFNYRYNAALPTVITTADDEKRLDPKLLSRLKDRRLVTVVQITAPSFRGGHGKPRREAKRSN
jgi:DNA replication protein DnaC